MTIMQIDAGLDTGDMLLKAETAIGPDETAPELSARLAPMGAELLVQTIRQIRSGESSREKQNNAEATLAPILKKEDGLVDWTAERLQQIYNRLRGFYAVAGRLHHLSRSAHFSLRARSWLLTAGAVRPGELQVEETTTCSSAAAMAPRSNCWKYSWQAKSV